MNRQEYEVLNPVKAKDLRRLRDLTKDVFSKIGTEKSRQRLIYDLLNTLKTDDRKRFLYIILKNANNLSSEERKYVDEFTNIFSNLYIEYETPENFEKIAYSIVMGIMAIDESKGGEKSE